ncbi:MAG: respiratory nitrate reductase subunit gamma [Alphaproteobacteria bacterium]|nr:respiratory nitrate reductase subunit gamma [Alphaproteobacteria bacterium]
MNDYLHGLVFGIYPYVCLSVFLLGSLIRFDREQYTWRSGSSQLLRARQLRWGSNLFHVGILFLFAGHLVGLLTPHAVYELVIDAGSKQMLAIVSGGIAGALCFVGLTLLLHRRLSDPRIRKTSSMMDIAILGLLWVQLVLGMVTLPYSLAHRDGSVMIQLSEWAQRIVTFRGDAAVQIAGVAWPYQLHIVLGLTIFLVFPFSRLVHIWSAPVWYVFRRYQVVRRRGPGALAR